MTLWPDRALYRRILGEARGHRLRIALILVLSLLATPLALLMPVPLKVVVDSVLGDRPAPGFLRALLPESMVESDGRLLVVSTVMLVGVVLLTQLQSLVTWLLQASTGERVTLGVRARLFRHVQHLPLAYHDRSSSADAAYRIQYDTSSFEFLSAYGVIPFATSAVTLVAMVVVTGLIDWQLAAVALLVVPLLFVLLRRCRARIRHEWRDAKDLEAAAYSVVQETLGALRAVKAFGQEKREEDRFVAKSTAGMRARIRIAFVEGTFDMLVGVTTAVGTAFVLYIGVSHVQAGTLTLGELLIVMGYLAQLYQPLAEMSKQAAAVQEHLASAERVYEMFDEATELDGRRGRLPLERAAGTIEFRNVVFAYGPDRPVLSDLSFRVEPGASVGIEGATGAGKTTLVSLLMRFYEPTSGEILLDGRNLRDYKLRDLRDQLALVLQEPVLFSCSVGENIAYGRPQASREEVVRAAELANADEFIRRLPQEYDTPVGERGVQLSGGQRQRVALARAFLKDAPILVLDEPTSSIDTGTEDVILEAMGRLMQGRTTLLIAHRSSTLANCKERIRIEDGRAVALACRAHMVKTGLPFPISFGPSRMGAPQ